MNVLEQSFYHNAVRRGFVNVITELSQGGEGRKMLELLSCHSPPCHPADELCSEERRFDRLR